MMDIESESLSYMGLLENDDSQVTEINMEVEEQPSTSEDIEEFTLITLQSASIDSEQQRDSESDDEKFVIVKRTKEEEQELTNKFLSGELTFSEYAAQYGESNYDDAVEEEEEDDDDEEDDNKFEASEKQNIPVESCDFEKNIAEIKENTSFKRRRTRAGNSRNKLPPALKGLMGEANLRYARGEHESAIKMCFEVIRQFPWAPEPFETLASLYDEKGDTQKALQVSLLAAHLNPRASKHIWINLAERSEEREDFKQASTCYFKALIADNKDFDLHMRHAALFEKMGDTKSELKSYLKLLRWVEPHHGEKLVEIAKMLAQKYHKLNRWDKAKEALQITFDKCPSLVNFELVNIMLEVLIALKDFNSAIDILVKFCNIEMKTFKKDNKVKIKDCTAPDNLVIDIYAKLVVILIHTQAFHLVDNFITQIKNMNPEDAGDVYFYVAEALITEEKFSEALDLLVPLTESHKFNQPLIWLRMAECFKAQNRFEDSIRAYKVVIERAPQLLGARLALSEIFNKLGRNDQALDCLTQDEDSELLDSALLYERCQLLQNMPDQVNQFIDVAHLFMSRHLVHITSKDDITALITLKSDRKKNVIKENKTYQKLFSKGNELNGEFNQPFNETPVEEEWQLFCKVCQLCLELERFDTLQRLTFSALGSAKFSKQSHEIELLCLSACYYNYDAYFGYNIVRSLVMKDVNSERSWNVFNMMILRADDSRHNRFLMRLLIKNPHHKALTILHANNCLVAGTYKYALSDYTAVYQRENSAMMAFLIAVTLCQMACQKFSAKKHSLVTQSVAYFWKYKELRGPEGLQESHYNIGRALHQLGLLPVAIHHYKKALEFNSKFIDSHSKYLDLRREAAFNLHLIYLSSGAKDIARMYLEKYVVV